MKERHLYIASLFIFSTIAIVFFFRWKQAKQDFDMCISNQKMISGNVIAERMQHDKQDLFALRHSYSRGAKDALITISLLNLELQLKNERKTFGEMSLIVLKRLKVEPDSIMMNK